MNCLIYFKKTHLKLVKELEDQTKANIEKKELKRFQLMNKIVKPLPIKYIITIVIKSISFIYGYDC